jgi:hypothetical protein
LTTGKADSPEAYTGTAPMQGNYGEIPERKVTFREMLETLRVMSNEEMSNYRMFGHDSRLERAAVLDAIANIILAILICADQVMPILRRTKGRGGVR